MAGTKLALIPITATDLSPTDLMYVAAGNGTLDRKMPVSLIGEAAFNKNAIDATPTPTIFLKNSTPATNGVQQFSPALRFSGQGFATTPGNSQPTEWQVYCTPIQGATGPTSQLIFSNSINGSAFDPKFLVTNLGQIFAFASVTAGSTVNAIGAVNAGTEVTAQTNMSVLAAGKFQFLTRSLFGSPNFGAVSIYDATFSGSAELHFGGDIFSFPAIIRNGLFLEFIAADGINKASTALYNTKTSTTNFERLTNEWSANVCRLWTEKGSGGGTARAFVLGADATELMRFESGSKLSFFGVAAVTRPSVPDGSSLATVIDALQALGLVTP